MYVILCKQVFGSSAYTCAAAFHDPTLPTQPTHLPPACLPAARDLMPLLSAGAYKARESILIEALLQDDAAYLALRRLAVNKIKVGGVEAGSRALPERLRDDLAVALELRSLCCTAYQRPC